MGLMALCVKAEVVDAFRSALPLDSVKMGVWPVTDPAMMKSLNGEWQLKVVKGIDDDKAVPAADATWGRIPVPGCWESCGFCEPKYDYPDSLTGYYRTEFTVPSEWRGQQVYIRLDGVLRGYDLWLNDQLVGSWQSAYNTCLFDLTPYLRKKGPQQLALRVYTRFKGYEFDCFDDWATNGIFRDITLMAVPRTHLSDLTVTTRMNGEVTVQTEVANATKHTTTAFELMDAQGKVVLTENGTVAAPQLWTAETPYLYTLRVQVKEKDRVLQTFTQKIGIRELTIDGVVLKLNGQPIKLRGVNAHSTDPSTVKVVSDDLTLKDMRLMKEASVNYMRLSHYPREPRFYELADSLGFYLVSEVPFGYGDKHLSSRSYQDILLTRANATVRRDKLHPSVLVWSVGNENPLPQTCVEVGDYVGQLDPSRPYCFPQVGSYFRRFWSLTPDPSPKGEGSGHPFPSKAPIYAPHYPTTGQIGGFYQHLDRPVIFTEYCHTLGTSFEDHDRQWEIIERTPGIAGGSVWEWADQGMPFDEKMRNGENEKMRNGENEKMRNGENEKMRNGHRFGYEERVFTVSPQGGASGFEMYGNKGTDGLVYADRTPLPNYYELQHNYARAFVKLRNVENEEMRNDSLNLSFSHSLILSISNRFDFLNLKDNVTFHWVLTADRDTVARGAFSPECPPHHTTTYPLNLPAIADSTRLGLLHFTIADAQGHTFLRQSFPVAPHHLASRLLAALPGDEAAEVTAALQTEPLVRTGRKATLAEMIKVKDSRIERYLQPLSNPYVAAQLSTTPHGAATRYDYTLTPDTTDAFLSELGIAFLLNKKFDRVQWIGQGPYASYPGRHQACRYGFWALQQDDLYFEGNRMGVDAAWVSDAAGNGLLIVGQALNLNFEQTDRGIVLSCNAAVSGLGPKFARTAFPVISREVGTVSGHFYLYPTTAGRLPQLLQSLFAPPASVPAPLHPFQTQYDTYLMRFSDIVPQ